MGELRCSECGAVGGQATCDCEMPYVPAGEYVAAKVLEHPELSNRALGERLGVGKETVRRVRQSVDPKGSTEKRKGKDGKSYAAKKSTPPKTSAEVIDLDPRRQVLQFRREAMKHLDEYERRFKAWYLRNPNLSEEAKDSLISAFAMCEEVFGELVHLIQEGYQYDTIAADVQS